jgi:hypothetical protein
MSTIGIRSSQGLGVGSRATPTIPTNVIAYRSDLTNTIISWSPPLVNGNSIVSSYRVEFSSNNGSTWSTVGDTSNLTLTHSGLTDFVSSTYRYRVSATNSVGFGPSRVLVGTTIRAGGFGFSGTTSWTVPAGVTRASVIVVGGGGNSAGGGAGGGGGGVSVGYGLSVSGTIPCVVGAGGIPGGSSSFGTTVLTATGGNTGSGTTGGSSGSGGGTGANILASTSKAGGTGGVGFNGSIVCGGGGGAQTAGGPAFVPNSLVGGAGGTGYTFLGFTNSSATSGRNGGGGGGYGPSGTGGTLDGGSGSGAPATASSISGIAGLVGIQYFV